MQYLFDIEGQWSLKAFAERGTLLALDYDGTLAPIVSDPRSAGIRESTRTLLARLSRRLPIIIVTGRARLDVMPFLDGIGVMEVIGNHGAETASVSNLRHLRMVRAWLHALAGLSDSAPGVRIENKRYSLSIHYRECEDREHTRADVLIAAGRLRDARILQGKDVVSVVPADAPDKGAALLSSLSRFNSTRAIFVGDDDTDEDVFRLGKPESLLSIRVGQRDLSSASYFIRDQTEVDKLLELLEQLASASSRRRRSFR